MNAVIIAKFWLWCDTRKPGLLRPGTALIASGLKTVRNTTKQNAPMISVKRLRTSFILERAFAMPLTSPAYPPGPYRFVNREYLIITYRTDPARLRAVVPEPLELDEREALVKYEFIRMPDSNGFGDYTESGQVIPVSFRGRKG